MSKDYLLVDLLIIQTTLKNTVFICQTFMVYFCCVVRSLCRLVWKMWLDGTNWTGLDNFNLLADGTLTLLYYNIIKFLNVSDIE